MSSYYDLKNLRLSLMNERYLFKYIEQTRNRYAVALIITKHVLQCRNTFGVAGNFYKEKIKR